MSDGALTAGRPAKRQPLLRLLTDERLAKLACEGSSQAFAAIYERHYQAVYRYSRSILGSDEDARDALQSTMLKAMQALPGESREIALRPWLFRIAHNESISLLRRRPSDAPIDRASEIAAIEADPEARERLRALIADLDQLSLRQRSALVMRELNGLEFEEIGVALDASPEAAKQAVYEARLALHQLEAGREMSCDEALRAISAQDRRLLRGRLVRGHLRSCEACAAFERSTRARRSQLACLAPPLPAPIALGILEGLLGGGGGGGGIAGLAGGGAAAGLGASTAAKFGVAGILALAIGTAAFENGEPGAAAAGGAAGAPVEQAVPPTTSSGAVDRTREPAGERSGEGARAANRDREQAGGGGGGGSSGHSAPASGGAVGGQAFSGGAGAAATGDVQAIPNQADPPSPAGGSSDPGQGGGDDPSIALPSPPPVKTGGGRGPAGLPPGHGGVPPGLGGVPPGLGAPPPGHTGSPPHGGLPPGQGGELPGRGP